MQGYDKEDAQKVILQKIDRSGFASLPEKDVEKWVSFCLEADFAYMKKAGLLDGDGFYDDDDAFDFIVEEVIQKSKVRQNEELVVATFVDAYMDAQASYMEEKGLLSWE